jgi:ATP-dependent Zn protease
VRVVGAMAAEHVFYNENSTGVSGDLHTATTLAAYMAGVWGMGPEQVTFDPPLNKRDTPPVRAAVMTNFQRLGDQIMNRASADVGAVLGDPAKRQTVALLLGQAFYKAHARMAQNRRAVEYVADQLIDKKELHGDEVVDLLDRAGIKDPTFDYVDPESWPKI